MAVPNQSTTRQPVTIRGSALHTGNQVTLTVKPAAPNTGYVFKRVDLADQPIVTAHIDNVKQVERATTLGEGSVKIHTVEHLLSALRGLHIDNASIEIDASEPPIGDGSGKIFVEALHEAGRQEQEEPVAFYKLREPVQVHGKDGSYLIAWPSDHFEVSCTNANHTGKHTQFLHWKENPEKYSAEIAQARTFVFYEEVQGLMEKGLIKGGSLENAVVIRGESVLSREPLRYEDEFVRHKILDIIGDLTLFPVRLKAHIYGAKPSHALNVELARAIYKQYKANVAQALPMDAPTPGPGAMDVNDIMKVLPHRFPFLMVDRVLQMDETTAIGQKSVSINESFFQGHFPGHPVMPGVLQLEAMAQVASLVVMVNRAQGGRLGYFMSADKVKFRKPVFPGDTLLIKVELTKSKAKIGKATGQCLVNNEVVSEAELMFAFIDA